MYVSRVPLLYGVLLKHTRGFYSTASLHVLLHLAVTPSRKNNVYIVVYYRTIQVQRERVALMTCILHERRKSNFSLTVDT